MGYFESWEKQKWNTDLTLIIGMSFAGEGEGITRKFVSPDAFSNCTISPSNFIYHQEHAKSQRLGTMANKQAVGAHSNSRGRDSNINLVCR